MFQIHVCLLFCLSFPQIISANDDDNMQLIFVQALWRHGDRTPTETYKNDKFTSDYWIYGGGGWGQLTPNGMRQHMRLGEQIRNRYINGSPYTFLSPRYNQQEIFVRSTDKNRTLLSAFSNMVGMYGGQSSNKYNKRDIDYPSVSGWPSGFVPIPIHTIADAGDHLLSVDNYCPLQDTIWELAKQTDVVASYYNRTEVVELMENLTRFCGEDINPDNLWILYNALKIEKQYYPKIFQNMTPWYSDELFDNIDIVNSQVQDFQNGIGLGGIESNGIDLGVILRKIRGGTLVNDMYNHMVRKLECLGNTSNDCSYMNNLKFFAYSAHDTTLYALLALFGIANDVVLPRGYPLYSSCILLEQWQDISTNQSYFKLIYHRHENDTLDYTVTPFIHGCSGDLCDLEVLRNLSEVYKPDMELNAWCNYDILSKTSATRSLTLLGLIISLFYIL